MFTVKTILSKSYKAILESRHSCGGGRRRVLVVWRRAVPQRGDQHFTSSGGEDAADSGRLRCDCSQALSAVSVGARCWRRARRAAERDDALSQLMRTDCRLSASDRSADYACDVNRGSASPDGAAVQETVVTPALPSAPGHDRRRSPQRRRRAGSWAHSDARHVRTGRAGPVYGITVHGGSGTMADLAAQRWCSIKK